MPTCGALPVRGGVLVSAFGARSAGQHYGADIMAPEGTAVRAVRDGRVRFVADNGVVDRYGTLVVVDHGEYLTLSAHLASRLVERGQRVRAGQVLGTVGRTAGTRANPHAVFARDKPHLHLEFLSVWPVQSGGAGRLDANEALAELGIIPDEQGRLVRVCGPEPSASSDGAIAILIGLGLWWWARNRRA